MVHGLVTPTQQFIQCIQKLQVCLLVFVCHLYPPADLPQETAMILHRVRRRALLNVLSVRPQHSWVRAWLLRLWNFWGHVHRVGSCFGFSKVGCRVTFVCRNQPNRVLARWLHRQVACLWPANAVDLADKASDRDGWRSMGPRFAALVYVPPACFQRQTR